MPPVVRATKKTAWVDPGTKQMRQKKKCKAGPNDEDPRLLEAIGLGGGPEAAPKEGLVAGEHGEGAEEPAVAEHPLRRPNKTKRKIF